MMAQPRLDGHEGRLRLETWKQIATYFGRDVRTAKRWEVQRGLPVHRLPGGGAGQVYAYADELAEWLRQSGRVEEGQGAADKSAALSPAPGLAQSSPAHKRRSRLALAAALASVLPIAGGAGLVLQAEHNRGASAAPAHAAGAHRPDAQAQQLYLKGVYAWNTRTPQGLQQAVDLFTQAIVRDPQYAEPYAGLANCYNLLREYTLMPPEQAYPRAKAAAERAIALDDRLSSAHSALGFVDFFWSWDAAGARREFERAIQLDPSSATAHHWYATFMMHLGDWPHALREIERAQELQPESASILADRGDILLHAGRIEEGKALLDQVVATQPEFLSPHIYLSELYMGQPNWPLYLREQERIASLKHDASGGLDVRLAATAYRLGGESGLLETMAKREQSRFDAGSASAYELARSYALLGDKARTLQLLAVSVRRKEPPAIAARIDFPFRTLQGDPDFERVIRPVGLPRAS